METLASAPRRRSATFGHATALRRLLRMSGMLVLFLSFAGCVALPKGSVRDPRDHAERFNRTMYKFNSALDHAVLRPVARGYLKAPAPVRSGVSNFLTNLSYTRTIVNDIFQARIRDFGNDVARLIVNTTVGLGGLFDPATQMGLDRHDRDFGQTLGKWGVHPGSYLMLPLLGPSDVRDAFGTASDRFMTVDGYIDDATLGVDEFSLRALDTRADALPSDSTVESAYDPYAFVRSAWFQMRNYKVHEGEKNYVPDLQPLDPGGGE
jgi:phospholipid-binding lipoprotein MlaA